MIVVAPALAGPGKGYRVDIDGAAVEGRTVSFTATFTVPATEKQQLGSARLIVPANYTLVDATIAAPATKSIVGDAATFENLALQPTDSITVKVQAEVPCINGGEEWLVFAKQANEFKGTGNDLVLNVDASDRITELSGDCKPCEDGDSAEVCQDDESIGGATFTLRGIPDPVESDAGDLELALNAGLNVTCPNYAPATSGTVLFDFDGNRSKTARLEVPKRAVPKDGLQLCFGSPVWDPSLVEQVEQFDWDGDGSPDPVYVKLLPDCVDAADPGPCVTGRSKPGASVGFIEARLPEGDPGMRG